MKEMKQNRPRGTDTMSKRSPTIKSLYISMMNFDCAFSYCFRILISIVKKNFLGSKYRFVFRKRKN